MPSKQNGVAKISQEGVIEPGFEFPTIIIDGVFGVVAESDGGRPQVG
jgi:hypothetical protein